MRIGWVMEDPGYKGGAELEADVLAANAPEWAELVPCPLTAVSREVDAYIVHNCADATDKLIGYLGDKPTIRRVHDLWKDQDATLRAWFLENAALFILSSPLQREALAWDISRPVIYVPSAVETDTFRAAGRAANGREGALWLGRLYEGKGIERAREWAEQNDAEIDVYGFGSREGDIVPPLNYCGRVDYADVPALMARYEKFVFLPDAVEPYGRTAAEAWLAGCECILNRNVGALWWLENEPGAVDAGAARFWQAAEEALNG